MSTCRSCGAEIVWRRHYLSRKRAPIDVEPHPDGRVVLLAQEAFAIDSRRARSMLPAVVFLGPRYMPHYATCPDADAWRR